MRFLNWFQTKEKFSENSFWELDSKFKKKTWSVKNLKVLRVKLFLNFVCNEFYIHGHLVLILMFSLFFCLVLSGYFHGLYLFSNTTIYFTPSFLYSLTYYLSLIPFIFFFYRGDHSFPIKRVILRKQTFRVPAVLFLKIYYFNFHYINTHWLNYYSFFQKISSATFFSRNEFTLSFMILTQICVFIILLHLIKF